MTKDGPTATGLSSSSLPVAQASKDAPHSNGYLDGAALGFPTPPPRSRHGGDATSKKTPPATTSAAFRIRLPFSRSPRKDAATANTPSSPSRGKTSASRLNNDTQATLLRDSSSAKSPSALPSVSNPQHATSGNKRPQRSPDPQAGDGPHEQAKNTADGKHRISMDIPSSDLLGLDSLDQLSFSNRGSILLKGQKAQDMLNGHMRKYSGRRQLSLAMMAQAPTVPERVLSTDEETLSQTVRSLYEHGDADASIRQSRSIVIDQRDPGLQDSITTSPGESSSPLVDVPDINGSMGNLASISKASLATDATSGVSSAREESERAGGIEDWEGIDGRDLDRYGFILPARKTPSRESDSRSSQHPRTPEPQRPQRVSTLLQIASEAPRRKRSLRRKSSATANTASSDKTSSRSAQRGTSIHSNDTYPVRSASRTGHFRYAVNRLPGHKDRRFVDEAGDMLTLPPGLADIAEEENGDRLSDFARRKESARTEKWTSMARAVNYHKDGRGMTFEFDTSDPKLISRTWKGIPDRWRATAWHQFLSKSAAKSTKSVPDEQLFEFFRLAVGKSCADDVQIDIDVPRTINSHIMFRRRYRGGQRLLFRVLHCLSLYFPNTGYVQGMATLAATLLCYYDEEMAFLMLVRLWQLRGLQRLYDAGFEGLMEALREFEKKWLSGGDVAKKLAELGIDATAYGTRWYLTLFNYSIPFAAQLRVWDVFMLLGDSAPGTPPAAAEHGVAKSDDAGGSGTAAFGGCLDVLHATSAALIDATREILLDSDFENAMRVLTSWVPIKDEDLLMRVAQAEYKMKRRRS
ncbi:MAG: hypothetical protein M1825_006091 [Sarcosagium campestre]|nr:MAG: hypothetical protein M1825_006091 [Sarcosagium campestre]